MSDEDEDFGPSLPPPPQQQQLTEMPFESVSSSFPHPQESQIAIDPSTSQAPPRKRERDTDEGQVDDERHPPISGEVQQLVNALPRLGRYERSFMHGCRIHDLLVVETPDGATIVTVDCNGVLRWFKKIPRGVFFLQQSKPLATVTAVAAETRPFSRYYFVQARCAKGTAWLVEAESGVVFTISVPLMMVESRTCVGSQFGGISRCIGLSLPNSISSSSSERNTALLLMASGEGDGKLMGWLGAADSSRGGPFAVTCALAHPLVAAAQHPFRTSCCILVDEKGILDYVYLRPGIPAADDNAAVGSGSVWLWDSVAQLRRQLQRQKDKSSKKKKEEPTAAEQQLLLLPDPSSSSLFYLFKRGLIPSSITFDSSGHRFVVLVRNDSGGSTVAVTFKFEDCSVLASVACDSLGPSPRGLSMVLRSPASSQVEQLLTSPGEWTVALLTRNGALCYAITDKSGRSVVAFTPSDIQRVEEGSPTRSPAVDESGDKIFFNSGSSFVASLCDVHVARTQALKNLIGASQLGSLLQPESLFKIFAVGSIATQANIPDDADPTLFVVAGDRLLLFSKFSKAASAGSGAGGRDLDCAQVVEHAESRRLVTALGAAPAEQQKIAPLSTTIPASSSGPAKRFVLEIESFSPIVVMELWPALAPLACKNFELLSARGFYNGLTFHRVIKDFMIQGGCPKGDGTGGQSAFPDAPTFADENLEYDIGSQDMLLCMANCGKDTNGSQFFITVAPAPWLKGKHTVFGIVVEGQQTVRAVSVLPTRKDGSDAPIKPVKIRTIALLEG